MTDPVPSESNCLIINTEAGLSTDLNRVKHRKHDAECPMLTALAWETPEHSEPTRYSGSFPAYSGLTAVNEGVDSQSVSPG